MLPSWFDDATKQVVPRTPEWEGIISHLLIAAKGSNVVDRSAAISRLHTLLRWQILTEDEKNSFAAALWSSAHRDLFGIPQHTDLRRWVFLTMPEEHPGQAREALLHFVIQRSGEKGSVPARLEEIGELLSQFKKLGIPIELSEIVKISLATLIETWAVSRVLKSEV